MVIVNDRVLTDEVGYGECAISCLLREVVHLSAEAKVRVRASHYEVQMVEVVVCSVVSSCEWGFV